jgi:hypothetical protein
MDLSSGEIAAHFAASLARAEPFTQPFRHFFAENLFPADLAESLADLPIAAAPRDGMSGKRDDHNEARCFLSETSMRRFPVLGTVAGALQSAEVVDAIATLCGAALTGTFLRVEYAVDCEGFWLEPHTDLGVKKFTCLISLSKHKNRSSLGTDIYTADKKIYKRALFRLNTALIFVPGNNTWHGFSKRPIPGDRRSLIVNYVGPEWREREQLAFPMAPVR